MSGRVWGWVWFSLFNVVTCWSWLDTGAAGGTGVSCPWRPGALESVAGPL